MKIASLILLFVGLSLSAQVKEVTIEVEVPRETDTLYITGNQPALGDWDASAVMLKKTSANKRSITLPLTFPAEFKFTRGNWDKEGYIGDKYNIENIKLTEPLQKVNYKILGWYDEGNFLFDEEYILTNKGKHSIEAPEVQELVHIIMALTQRGIEDKNLINQEGEYYQKVMKTFGKFKDDPVVLNMDILLNKGMYIILKMDACGFYFDGNNIVKDKTYNKLSWNGPNSLEPFIADIQAFGKKVNFRKFYNDNLPFYRQLIEQMEDQAEISEQWKWLENNFDLKYDNYRITFSPLTGGSHSTNRFVQKDFKQTVMFIRGPIEDPNYSEAMHKGFMNVTIFTEIDHNYVNPVSDRYAKEIKAALPNLSSWAAPQALEYYGNEYMVFNEYVTWAVFSLYAREKFEKQDFDELNEYLEDMMANRRGFTRYKEFNRKLMEIYDNRNTGQKIHDLYPQIIDYFKTAS